MKVRLYTYDKRSGLILGISGITTLTNAHRIAHNNSRTVDIVLPATW